MKTSFAKGENFVISKVIVNCHSKFGCEEAVEVFNSLRRKYTTKEHFYTVFKLYVGNEGIKELHFSVNDRFELMINLKLKPQIIEIDDPAFTGNGSIEIPSVLPIKEGEFLDQKKVLQSIKIIKDIAKESGYVDASVEIENISVPSGIILRPKVKLGEPILVKNISVISKSEYLNRLIRKKYEGYINGPFNLQEMKLDLEDIRRLFIQYGYYLVDFNFKYRIVNSKEVNIYFEIINTDRYLFYLDDIDYDGKEELKTYLRNLLTGARRELNVDSLEFSLKDFFTKKGYSFSKVQVNKDKFKDLNEDQVINYKVDAKKGIQSKVIAIQFKGNSFFSSKNLEEEFYLNAGELSLLDIYDVDYYATYKKILREKYIASGFLGIDIEDPEIQFEVNSKKVQVIFKIREGLRTLISDIQIDGLLFPEKQELLKVILNKQGQAFNPIEFKNDLERIEDYLKKEGYYFAQIENMNKKSIVRYLSDNSQVEIYLNIARGPKIYADQILIVGNKKTKKKLILRELEFESGSLLTREAVEKSQANLLQLGIFSTVRIKPISTNEDSTDVIVFVKEKDFGSIEIAPGFRSDIGLKFTSSIVYNNIDGMNKRISFQGTANRRFDLHSLDDERRVSNEHLIEYDASINFLENHIFYSDYNFAFSMSQARKRFVSYDADIRRVSYTVSTQYFPWLSASIRQQLEIVSQFNATPFVADDGTVDDSNHGHFQIGSFAPALTIDFRDRAVNPSSGAELDLTFEFANPFFLSQSNEELTVDYYKFISRNKVYFPLSDYGVLALSAAMGIQENLASRKDYIPGIKVFRLSGVDIIRGFEDEEMNTLVSGFDINDTQVNTKAYMASIKVEPRYYLSDSSVLGVFYDAGRVFVDEFSFNDFRSSVGLSFKYITPVGTLDLSYGIKTLRKTNSSGRLESPGKLHLSIGFF